MLVTRAGELGLVRGATSREPADALLDGGHLVGGVRVGLLGLDELVAQVRDVGWRLRLSCLLCRTSGLLGLLGLLHRALAVLDELLELPNLVSVDESLL